MKKIYILGLALFGLTTINAQLTDDFEGYPTGPYFGGHWGNWSGSSGAENIIIAEDGVSVSGVKAGFIGNDGVQDAVLKLGNKTSGVWTLEWKMYLNFASTGYYNFQENEVIGAGTWGLNVFFNYEGSAPGQAIIADDANPANVVAQFNYTEEEWITIRHEYDLGAGTVKISVDGTEVYSGDAYLQAFQLGAVDFFSIDTSNSYYIDDVVFVEGGMGVNDSQNLSSISVYPTVAKDIVNVSAKSNISEVSVFNTNGQQVLKVAGQGTSAQVNVSTLPAGVYIVKTVAGKETKTTKVVVK